MSTDTLEQHDLAALSGALADAYNNGDLDGVVNLFAEDGVFVNSDGSRFIGHDQIRQVTDRLFQSCTLSFDGQDIYMNEETGKVLLHWHLKISDATRTSLLDGVDVLHWANGKLKLKSTYFKTDDPKNMDSSL